MTAAVVCGGKWGSARSQYCVLSGSHEQHDDSAGRTWGRRRGAKPEPIRVTHAREVLAEYEAYMKKPAGPGWDKELAGYELRGRLAAAVELLLEAYDQGELR